MNLRLVTLLDNSINKRPYNLVNQDFIFHNTPEFTPVCSLPIFPIDKYKQLKDTLDLNTLENILASNSTNNYKLGGIANNASCILPRDIFNNNTSNLYNYYGTGNHKVIPIYLTNCRLFILRGALLFSNSNGVVPLISLMIQNDYIEEFRKATILPDSTIDYTKFEWWINVDFNTISSLRTVYNHAHTKVLKYFKNPDNIKVVVKSGLTEYYSNVRIPELKSISDRMEWLQSVKNGYLNSINKNEELPVKKFETKIPEIRTVTEKVKFKSMILNNLIKNNSNTNSNPKTIKHNKYELI